MSRTASPFYPLSYTGARAFLQGGRRRDRRTVPGLKSTVVYLDDKTTDIVVQYHATDVIRFHDNGTFTLNSGGWRTMTTKERMATMTNARIWSDRGEWKVSRRDDIHAAVTFEDGMVFNQATGAPIIDPATDRRRTTRSLLHSIVRQAITRYVRATVDLARRNKRLPTPYVGDCFYCYQAALVAAKHPTTIQTGTMHPSGEVTDTTGKPALYPVDHMLSHLGLGSVEPGECYLEMGSLLWLAYQRHGNPSFVYQMSQSDAAKGDTPSFLAVNVRHYLKSFHSRMVDALVEDNQRRPLTLKVGKKTWEVKPWGVEQELEPQTQEQARAEVARG